MTYFFGSVAIAVICAVKGPPLLLVTGLVALVLLGAFILDHSSLLRSVDKVKLTLDAIHPDALADPAAVRVALSARLAVDVMSYQVRQIDYVNEVVRLDVYYRARPRRTRDNGAEA